MVKNIRGGNKAKQQKRGFVKKPILDKTDEGQLFGQVTVKLGGNHFTILCSDNISRIGRLGGAARRGAKLEPGVFVIVSLRDFETSQKNCDIIGTSNPPSDIRKIFKDISPGKTHDNVEFLNSDDEFDDFEESELPVVTVTDAKSKLSTLSTLPVLKQNDELVNTSNITNIITKTKVSDDHDWLCSDSDNEVDNEVDNEADNEVDNEADKEFETNLATTSISKSNHKTNHKTTPKTTTNDFSWDDC